MTQDIVGFILFFSSFFTCLWSFRLLPFKKEIINYYWTHQHGRTKFKFTVEINLFFKKKKKAGGTFSSVLISVKNPQKVIGPFTGRNTHNRQDTLNQESENY